MHWTRQLIHNETPYFTSPAEAAVGESARIRLRAPAAAPVRQALLVSLVHGEPRYIPMTALPERGPWRDWEAMLPLHGPVVRYAFVLVTPADTVHVTTRGARHYRGAFRDWFQYLAGHHAPAWLPDRVFYQVFVDRFRNGDPSNDVRDGEYLYEGKPVRRRPWSEAPDKYGDVIDHYGGDLDGIADALPYLEGLGANGLYLTPVFDSPSNHRYDTRDYHRVDPHLGGERALRRLLDEAHARGVKVVLDGVFNHTGSEHAGFRAAQQAGLERELFTFDEGGSYRAFFDVPTLPKIDYSSERAFEAFIDGPSSPVREWLRFGADGWRLDVAHMIGAAGGDRQNLEVHRRLKRAAREEDPEAYVFGERSYDSEAALQPGDDGVVGEDGVMNYHGFCHPVVEWLSGQRVWGSRVRVPAAEVAEVMHEAYRVLPPAMRAGQYNLIGSHDIPRALWRMREDKSLLRAAFTLLLAYPGVPGLYYGDEIGLSGAGIPFNRAPFPWDESRWDGDLLAFVTALTRARRDSLELQRGALAWLHAAGDAIAFARPLTGEDGETTAAVCAVSKRGSGAINLDLRPAGVLSGRWRDATSGEEFTAAGGQLALDLSSPRLLLPA
ncbi:MAG TPA: alpha-amylase family glycosyl hydrolase [Deinococcales bacterium]|nr:alpha-amylase family glycosyl hydrolase [Deinococcales bacterium]